MSDPSRATLPLASAARVRRVVGARLRRHRGRTVTVGVLYLAASGLALILPASLGWIVDAVSTGSGMPTIGGVVALAGLSAIAAALVLSFAARVLVGLVQDVLAGLREDVFASAMRLPVSTVDDGETADLVSRVTGDVEAVAEAGGNVAPTLLSAAFAIATSVIALAVIDPRLALAGLAAAPFYVVGTQAFLRRSRVVFRDVRAREAARSQAVLETVEGIETLTAFGEQEQALERVRARAHSAIEVQVEGVRVSNRLFRWINGGELIGLSAILIAGFLLQSAGAVTVGMVTTAALVFHRLFGPVGQVIFGLDEIQRATVGLARLVGVIDLAPPASPLLPPTASAETPAAIEVRGVTFLHPTTGRGITDVTLRVAPGTTTALVGSSGSGKSTLARVVAGHYPPTVGSVHLSPGTVRPYYLSQELHHFRGTIGDNLRLVAPGARDADLVAALRSAGAEWAVDALEAETGPHGDPSVSAAVPLDEGRIQQLAIARALLADPVVVILDEATAEIGGHHRDAVESALTALCRGRTALLIAHRLPQAATARQIVVFADGRATQRGTHAALLATEGPYRRAWEIQTQHETDSPTPAGAPREPDETENP
ncbi:MULTISPECIES: ABC transporter ATP-binding protein [Microbacterium]|uniref:ABC transporter ATP-binding protein n=1 Tax=Microbacterium TaxID=33882 RepID=UPI00277D459A|nr:MULTISPECIES: ABC transporter ATP-binding protein [Microbacterium]MDQ1082773.1 ABC-type multidrug transport system fused ATPase/permease subunit [Microbacterium sp. SORGH_AS_0344]MDQ1168458.1 ABC-type multidrug transport system fused ATPase/permease subunit [Microbacterium proteolyticum]